MWGMKTSGCNCNLNKWEWMNCHHLVPWAGHWTGNCSSVKHVNDYVGRCIQKNKERKKTTEDMWKSTALSSPSPVPRYFSTFSTDTYFFAPNWAICKLSKIKCTHSKILVLCHSHKASNINHFCLLFIFLNCFWCKHVESTSTNAGKTPHYPLNRARHSQNWDSLTWGFI